jgi:hypothetical protein
MIAKAQTRASAVLPASKARGRDSFPAALSEAPFRGIDAR